MVSVLLEYIGLFNIFKPNTSYYAGIMLDAFRYLLCSKLCWHNWRKPNADWRVRKCNSQCLSLCNSDEELAMGTSSSFLDFYILQHVHLP